MKKGIHLTDLPSIFAKKTRKERKCGSSADGNFTIVTKFLPDRWANVSAKLTSTYYRRSTLVQGDIKIPCVVTVSMLGAVINQLLMERYKQLVETLYTEPKEEEILGTFLQLENTGEQDLAPVAPKQKKKPKCPPGSDKNQKDIQSYFAATPRQATKKSETKKPKSPNVITIDWILDSSTLFVF